jgi:ribosomal protein S18 acetylase RimI-like enzyme
LGHKEFSAYESCLGYFEWIAVSKEHQREGIGSALCEEMLKRFGEMGVSRSNPTQREFKAVEISNIALLVGL